MVADACAGISKGQKKAGAAIPGPRNCFYVSALSFDALISLSLFVSWLCKY